MLTSNIPLGSSVAVIGAGIVGVSSACALNQKGYHVSIYDPSNPGEGGASKANAGHIGASDIFPLSVPGIHFKALKMLFDSDAPLKIPLSDFWSQIPWFCRFLLTSHGSRFQKATDAISFLGKNSLNDTKTLLESYDLGEMVDYGGCAFIYDTKKSFNSSKKGWNERAKRGFSSESLNEESIAKITPAINNKFKHAFLSHEWGKVTEPFDIVKNLSNEAQKSGVVFYKNQVKRISESLNSVLIDAENGSFKYDAVIIAAGIDSILFAKSLGDFLPITSERGYNLTIPSPNIKIDIPIVFADRGIVATSLRSGLRIGGWAEYANPRRPANQAYFDSISRISQELFPGLNIEGANFWMGSRPSMPDSLPVISRSQKLNRVFYNCGHGHYGLTHAATSAKLMCDLITNNQNVSNSRLFSIDRFL
jgi:D-amino-acid dehydrogenase